MMIQSHTCVTTHLNISVFMYTIGAPKVGRNELKRRLMVSGPKLYQDVVPCMFYF